MGWIHIPRLKEKSEDFIKKNPSLKLSKCVVRNRNFVFYRKYRDGTGKIEHESAEFRLILVLNEKKLEGWSVDYMRHTGKWENLPIFGNFEACLEEIKSGDWAVVMPFE